MGWPAWLRQAFAVDVDEGPPSPRQVELVEALCGEIVRRGLSAPALAFLELSRPLNYVAAQAMHFLMPVVTAVAPGDGPQVFAEFLERRGAVEELCQSLERRLAAARTNPAEPATAPGASSDHAARSPQA